MTPTTLIDSARAPLMSGYLLELWIPHTGEGLRWDGHVSHEHSKRGGQRNYPLDRYHLPAHLPACLVIKIVSEGRITRTEVIERCSPRVLRARLDTILGPRT